MQYTASMLKVYLANDAYLAVIQILKKALNVQKKIMVVCSDQTSLDALSIKLWNARTFLPHTSEITDDLDFHPIFLTLEEDNVIDADNFLYVNKLPLENEKAICVFEKDSWNDSMNDGKVQVLNWIID